MERSSAAIVEMTWLTILQILLWAVVGYAENNSSWCNVTLKSGSVHIPCNVNLTRCDQRVKTLSLFSPPVNNLQVSVKMLQDKASDQYLNSLTTMRWCLPDRSETLTGFLVHLQTADGLSNRCYLLSIPWTARKDDPQFEFYLPLEPNNYSVRVHSYVESSLVHGSPNTVPRRTLVVKPRKKAYRNSPAYWITDLVVCSNSCSRSITVKFELAPDAYDFGVYTVSLRQISYTLKTKLHVESGQQQGTVLFSNLTSGNYTVVVSPENTDWNNPRLCRCQCRGIKSSICIKSCPDSGCLDIVSNVITIDNVNADDCLIVTDDPLLLTKVTAIAIGCFLATGLIALFAWILLRPKHIDIDVHMLDTQNVFVLFRTDHPRHKDVVHQLRHFLRRHCNCSVRTMHDDEHEISEHPYRYFKNMCLWSSSILLINSEGLVYSSLGPETETFDPLDPMVQPFLEYLRPEGIDENKKHQLLITKFDYTKTNDTAKYMNYHKHEYVLMQEVELLILHIHGFEKRKGRCVYHIRGIQKSLKDSLEGRRLSEAVSLMKGFTVNDHQISQDQEPLFPHGTREERKVDDHADDALKGSIYTGQIGVREPTPAESYDLQPHRFIPPSFNSLSLGSDGHADALYASESTSTIGVGEPTPVDSYDGEPADEFDTGKRPDVLDFLPFPLVPPSSDSSSLASDEELWSNEFNADFDTHVARILSWMT